MGASPRRRIVVGGGADGSARAATSEPHRWLVEPARPDWLRANPRAPAYALATVCVGACIGQLDASIVTLAFPTLQRDFHASVGAVTWVGLSYLAVLVVGVTPIGRLADMVGRKLLYTYGFGVFIAGSALCAAAPTLAFLDAARGLQAIGAAMLQANSVAIIYVVLPRDRLRWGIGIQGAAQALGLALGPAVGGLLLSTGGWRLLFLINVPIGLVAAGAAWVFVPRSCELQARQPFDWVGLTLFAPAVASLLLAVSLAGRGGWASARSIVLLVVAVGLGLGFGRRERHARAPMLDLALLRQRAVSAGLASGLLSYVVLFGTMSTVPFLLERAQHLSAGRAGLSLTALPFAVGCVAPLTGRLTRRVSARALSVGGMGLTATALVALGTGRSSGWVLIATLLLAGAGLGLFTPLNNAAIVGAAPRAQAGVASGVLNMTRGFGTALGLALSGLAFGAGASGSPLDLAFDRAAWALAACALAAAALALVSGRASQPSPTPP
jgi:EmrB/QacA subfamily drug resistance transporter